MLYTSCIHPSGSTKRHESRSDLAAFGQLVTHARSVNPNLTANINGTVHPVPLKTA